MPRAPRTNGARFREIDGRWEARATIYGQRRSFYGRTAGEAEAARDRFERWVYDDPATYRLPEKPLRLIFPKGPCVYVARDRSGEVLYIGSSGNAISRIGDHARRAPWFESADTWEFYGCPTREAAFDLERTMIERLRPPHNVLIRSA